MTRWQSRVRYIRDNLFFLFAVILAVSFPFSESMISIAAGYLVLQLFFTADLKRKINVVKNDRSLWALIAVFFIYLVGCLFCRDWDTGLYELKKTVFWFFIPLGVALSRRLSETKFWQLLFAFILFVSFSTLIATYKIINQEAFHITDIRDASYVSHISFSFQIILSVFVLWYGIVARPVIFNRVKPLVLLLWSCWLVFFLILQKSLLGIISFYGSGLFFVIWLIGVSKSIKLKRWLRVSTVLIFFLPFFYVGYVALDFYTIKDELPLVPIKTSLGNNYSFDKNNKQKENGHYVYWFLCKKEIELVWNKRSVVGLHEKDATGYPIYDTLIRYMTSKDLRKDAQGIAALSDQDIENIQNGISNSIFVDKKYSLYPRIYQTVWEIDKYHRTGNPNNQSLSQRFEYMKAAFYIVRHNFWGIGTGNYKQEYAKAYKKIHTRLNPEFRFHVHNQYLSYLVNFGFVGLVLVFGLVFYSIYYKKQFRNVLLILLLLIILISNLGEAILETHVGLSFFVFFHSLFLWHSPKELSRSMLADQ
jgi:hypothetical protein